MTPPIFDKTDKGREEIATRRYRLAPRLRTLLVLIDGKQSTVELLKKVSGIGLNEESLAALLHDGFIHIQHTIAAVSTGTGPSATKPVPTSTLDIFPDSQNQHQAIYCFYTETIKSTIGLHGYALQLEVEKAASVEALRELRQPYLEAVLKAKGPEMECDLRNRLDQLLYAGETVSPNTTIVDLRTISE